MSSFDIPDLLVICDLRDPVAWQAARRHRDLWGKAFAEILSLDYDHIALVFRPAPDERWRPWESVRLEWIREDLQGSEAA